MSKAGTGDFLKIRSKHWYGALSYTVSDMRYIETDRSAPGLTMASDRKWEQRRAEEVRRSQTRTAVGISHFAELCRLPLSTPLSTTLRPPKS